MPIKTSFYPLLIACSFILIITGAGCKQSSETYIKSEPLTVERLDLAFSEVTPLPYDSIDKDALDLYFAVLGADSLDRNQALDAVKNSRAVKIFGHDIETRLGSLESVENSLGIIKGNIDSGLLPEITMSRVLGIVSPYRQSVIVADSVILVALNHYLGADYPGYNGLPQFQRESKFKERIPRDIAEALIRINYPYSPVSGTVMERMLYEGALAETVSRIAQISSPDALGVSNDDYNAFLDNEAEMWKYLAAHDMLYSTGPGDISRLVDPAPYTSGFPVEVPGQAGCFIGHQILKQYLARNPKSSLEFLLKPEFYSKSQDILISSGYSPVKQ